jgi:hypothetical protein
VSKATLTRRLDKLAHTETANIARRYKLPEAAADIFDRAAKVYGQKSRAIQVGVEILWRRPLRAPDGTFGLHVLPGAMETPLVGRSYKLPPRTVRCIEDLAEFTGMTQGGVLCAVAAVLAKPEPSHRAEKRK